MIHSQTALALSAVARPLRRRLAWLGVLGAAAGPGLVLAAAAWSARLGALRSPAWVPAAWALGLLAGALVGYLALRAARALRDGPLATRLERDSGWRSGALSGLLEPAASGTSVGLYAAADAQEAAAVARRAPDAVGPQAATLLRLLGLTAGALAGAVLLLGAAGVRRGPAALLWQPLRALGMFASPLRLRAEPDTVSAGDSVALVISAPGRRSVLLWTRSPGTTWAPLTIALDSSGQARQVAGPLSQALYAHITSGRRSSDTLEVAVRRPAFLAALTLTIRYPSYLRLEDEPAPASGDTLLLPAGSPPSALPMSLIFVVGC